MMRIDRVISQMLVACDAMQNAAIKHRLDLDALSRGLLRLRPSHPVYPGCIDRASGAFLDDGMQQCEASVPYGRAFETHRELTAIGPR